VSACPNHQTGRTPSVPLMTAMTLACANGFEINFEKLSDAEMDDMRHAGGLMRAAVPGDTYLSGTWWRIWDPVTSRLRHSHGGETMAYAVSAPDLSSVVVVMALTDLSAMGRTPPKLRLPEGSVDEGRSYEVDELWPSTKWRNVSTMQVHDLPNPVPRYARNVNLADLVGRSASDGPEDSITLDTLLTNSEAKKALYEPYVLPGSVLVRAGLPVWWEVDGDCVMLKLTAR